MSKRVAIIGAGPVGLAAAAHALERDMMPIVLEAGDGAGHAVRQWSHVRMFSPWSYNIDKASERLLQAAGWNSPDPEHYPTGGELAAQYLDPLASRTPLAKHIQTKARVVSVARAGFDKVKTAGREQAEFEIQIPERPRTVRGPCRCCRGRFRNLAGSQSGWPEWNDGHRRNRTSAAYRLRDAKRDGARPIALRRQDGCGAGRGPFGHRDHH